MISEYDITVVLHLADGSSIDVSNDVVQYADQHAIGTIPTWSLTLPHAYQGTPYTEFLNLGDMVEVSLINYDSRFGVAAEPYTVMVGMVQSLSTPQTTAENQASQVASLSGSSLAGPLLNESISYFLALGYLEGLLKTFSQLPPDDIQGKSLAEAMFNFTTRVAFTALRMERPQGTLKDLLSLAFDSVPGIGDFTLLWQQYEGSFWGFLESYSEQPLNELLIKQTRNLDAFAGSKSYGRVWGEDNSTHAFIMRPTPYPHSEDGNSVNYGVWNSLPLHNLLEPSLRLHPVNQQSMTDFDDGIYNFFLTTPKAFSFDEMSSMTYAPAIINDREWKRHGYRPLTWGTYLLGEGVDKAGGAFGDFFTRLNWRLATQNNRLDGYRGGSVGIRLAPHIGIGERVLLNHIANDDTTRSMYYVKGVSHNFTRASASTSLTLDRGLPEGAYGNDAVFLDGLALYSALGALYKNQGHAESDVTRYDTPGVHRINPRVE